MKLFPLFVLGAAAVLPALAQERVLTKAVEVRSLPFAEAEKGIPVRLRGVVVFIESRGAVFVQDETSTTFFRLPNNAPMPAVGDEIELSSKTRVGLYLPGLDDTTYRVVGQRELPPGIPATYDDLHFGRYHYQRVAVEGIVRSVRTLEPRRSLIRLAMGSRVVDVWVEQPLPPELSIVDHRVRVTGLAAGQINTPRRQLVQPFLRALDWHAVEVVAPAPPSADAPRVSVEELLAFRATGLGEQRVRLEGVVSAVWGGDQASLQQGEMAVAVRFGGPVTLTAGDHVTVVGFPAMDRFSASLSDAELLAREPGEPPAPVEVDSLEDLYGKTGQPLPGKYDGRLVRLALTVRDAFKSEEGVTLLVQSGPRTVLARMPDGTEIPPPAARIRLTAICQVETAVPGSGFSSRPGLISLRGKSPADLEVLKLPPWWTVRRLAGVLAVLAGLTLLAGLWIVILRRQVARQTAALRHRIETQAALEERQRIAREFHDTLEQELAGVSLRLDALATRPLDDKGRNLIAASRNLVSRIQTETRDLICDLRDATESTGDLAATLQAMAARQAAETGAAIRVEAAAELPLLAPAVVHDLRMIARESVTNAFNHGRASAVVLRVSVAAEALLLAIVDNGCGFNPAIAATQRRGHFGCEGIRERVRKIGGCVIWRSELQKGTVVEVTLPLARNRRVNETGVVEPPPAGLVTPAAAPHTAES
ncbi:MAG: sensor histidine kinase [Verrucomicrobia bacterium]|nr:sensor histidine kinase [Verrucomicrobiota bacterium]